MKRYDYDKHTVRSLIASATVITIAFLSQKNEQVAEYLDEVDEEFDAVPDKVLKITS